MPVCSVAVGMRGSQESPTRPRLGAGAIQARVLHCFCCRKPGVPVQHTRVKRFPWQVCESCQESRSIVSPPTVHAKCVSPKRRMKQQDHAKYFLFLKF